jgi:peroxiredoxin Q/BCP
MPKNPKNPKHELIGKAVPSIKLPSQDGSIIDLKKQCEKGFTVLYFYPKDDTPGCTQEACDFRDNFELFSKNKIQVLGVSPDPVKKHQKFAEKYDLNFPLLSDEDKKLCEAMKVWKLKKFMGREYMGVERSTFLIKDGKIIEAWQPVKVAGHVKAVIDAWKEFK